MQKFSCKITDIDSFTNIIGMVSSIIDTIKFEFDTDGLRLQALDNSHICFIKSEFKAPYFMEYSFTMPDSFLVDAKDFIKLLNRKRKDDELVLTTTNDFDLKLEFKNTEGVRSFKLALIDDNYETPSMPSFDTMVTDFGIPFDYFKKNLQDIQSVNSETVRITINNEALALSSTSDTEVSSYNSTYNHFGEDVNGECGAVYNVGKLLEFLKADKVNNTLMLSMGDDTPILMKLEDYADTVKLEFLCAPRLDNSN